MIYLNINIPSASALFAFFFFFSFPVGEPRVLFVCQLRLGLPWVLSSARVASAYVPNPRCRFMCALDSPVATRQENTIPIVAQTMKANHRGQCF